MYPILLLLIIAQAIKGQSFSNFPANDGGGAPQATGRQVRLPAATAAIPNNQQQQQQLQPAFVFNPQQQPRLPQQQRVPQQQFQTVLPQAQAQPQRFIPRQPQFANVRQQPRQPQIATVPQQQPQFVPPQQPRQPEPQRVQQPQPVRAQLPAQAAPAPVGSDNIEGVYVHDPSGDATISRFELFKLRKAAEAAQ